LELIINGQNETVPPCTISELVVRKGLVSGVLVVELNQQIIKQQQWQAIQLKENDRLELLSFVGGG